MVHSKYKEYIYTYRYDTKRKLAIQPHTHKLTFLNKKNENEKYKQLPIHKNK